LQLLIASQFKKFQENQMENAYQPEAWHNLYVMLGGSTAALTGLLFVATYIFGVVMVLNVFIRHGRKTPWGRKLRAGAVGLSCLLGMVGALSLLIQSGGGMYVITAAYLIFLCLTVSSAWVLMVGVYQPDHASELL
jgi:hypothetical protein